MSERAELKSAIKRVLCQRDASNPISMTQLFVQVTGEHVIPARKHEQSRVIRALVKELRMDGCPIAFSAARNGGYYWARSEDDLAPTLRTLHSHAMSNLQVEAALKRVPFNQLLQQYELEYDEQEVTE
jgi:hypothetical protein